MRPDDFVARLRRERASAILRCDDPEIAREAMAAAIAGGFRVVELTLTIPRVFALLRELAENEDLVVGAGTVLSPEDARRAVDSGARFLVSPVTDPEVIETAHELGVAMMPGTHTPTEMWTAHRAGAELVKLFPAPGIGPAFVRSVLGPLPDLKIVPTNGIDDANAREWLEAGAWALGLVAPLFSPRDLADRRFDRIERRARELLEIVRS